MSSPPSSRLASDPPASDATPRTSMSSADGSEGTRTSSGMSGHRKAVPSYDGDVASTSGPTVAGTDTAVYSAGVVGLRTSKTEGEGTDDPSTPRDPSTSHQPLHSFPPIPLSPQSTIKPLPRAPSPSTRYSYNPTSIPLASPPSIRSSVAPENIFGTVPKGLVGRDRPREVVRVQRDYSAGGVRFFDGWLWELEGRITPTSFQQTLNALNTILASAHDPSKSVFDNTLSILTLYLSPLIFSSHYSREMKRFNEVRLRANKEVFNPAGLNLLDPTANAFLFLDIEYY